VRLKAEVQKLVQAGEQLRADGVKAYADASVELHTKFSRGYEEWYRACWALLHTNGSSTETDFHSHYTGFSLSMDHTIDKVLMEPPEEGPHGYYRNHIRAIEGRLRRQIDLLSSLTGEVEARRASYLSALSAAYIEDEYGQAEELLTSGYVRAAGVVAGVAMERHAHLLAESNGVAVTRNPPFKQKADFSDTISCLKKACVITERQRKQLEGLYAIRTDCAHQNRPEPQQADVKRLVEEGRILAATLT